MDGGGARDSTREQIAEFAPEVVGRTQDELDDAGLLPRWLGDDRLHLSHRSALVRKDHAFYGPAFGNVPADLPYVWPDADPVEPPPDGPAGVPVWVVRSDGEECAGRIGASGAVDLPVSSRSGRRSPKWERQVRTFTEQMAVGDLVAVPVDGGARLLLGSVTGHAVGDGARFRRAVRWTARVERADVHRPATLQDPRCLFRVQVRL